MPLYPETGEHERIGSFGHRNRHASLGAVYSIVMIFIVLLTLVLILAGVYLASAMEIVNIPWFTNVPVNAQPLPVQGIVVPDLIGQDYTQAKTIAKARGFVLVANGGPETGKVSRQYPMPGTRAASGSSLLIDLTAS